MNSRDMSGGPVPAKRERRVVIVDDEDVVRDMMAMIVRDWCGEITILRFQNRDEAWQEVLLRDPDLLITDLRSDNVPGRSGDYGINGLELLTRLAKRRVKYPILVASGGLSMNGCEDLAKQCAGHDLNATFLKKPFTKKLFLEALCRCLGPGDNERGI